jgi:hypothetical protein
VQKLNNRSSITTTQRANRLTNRFANSDGNDVDNQQLVDQQLFDLDQLVGQLLDSLLGPVGTLLPLLDTEHRGPRWPSLGISIRFSYYSSGTPFSYYSAGELVLQWYRVLRIGAGLLS